LVGVTAMVAAEVQVVVAVMDLAKVVTTAKATVQVSATGDGEPLPNATAPQSYA
jgi:hypothetical protein